MKFRIDDVSPNTDMTELKKMIGVLNLQGITDIVLGINLFAKACPDGSVYPSPPFKDKSTEFFYHIDTLINPISLDSINHVTQASHGLIHFDHSRMDRQVQELSILASCSMLKSKVFIPPFNRFNEDTVAICKAHGIELMLPDLWKSLDYNRFEPDYPFWYFHPWRWNADKLSKAISSI